MLFGLLILYICFAIIRREVQFLFGALPPLMGIFAMADLKGTCTEMHGPPEVPRPMLHFCQFYSLSKEKVVGRYFGKYEFSERHGGRWAKLSPLSCSTPQPAVLERDDEFLTSVLEDPASPTARRRTAYMIYKLVEAHNEAFAHYHSMCPTRLNASAALASGKAGGGGGKARRPRLHDGHAS